MSEDILMCDPILCDYLVKWGGGGGLDFVWIPIARGSGRRFLHLGAQRHRNTI